MSSWSTTSLTTLLAFNCWENRFMTPRSSLLSLASYLQESGPRKWKLDSTKSTWKRVNWISKMVLIAPSTLSWWIGRPRWWSPRGPPRPGPPPMAWTCRTPPCSNLCVCQPSPLSNHWQWHSQWRKFKHRYHLGLSGVGARDIYLWVQKRFVLAKQLIHFKPSLLVDLSDN